MDPRLDRINRPLRPCAIRRPWDKLSDRPNIPSCLVANEVEERLVHVFDHELVHHSQCVGRQSLKVGQIGQTSACDEEPSIETQRPLSQWPRMERLRDVSVSYSQICPRFTPRVSKGQKLPQDHRVGVDIKIRAVRKAKQGQLPEHSSCARPRANRFPESVVVAQGPINDVGIPPRQQVAQLLYPIVIGDDLHCHIRLDCAEAVHGCHHPFSHSIVGEVPDRQHQRMLSGRFRHHPQAMPAISIVSRLYLIPTHGRSHRPRRPVMTFSFVYTGPVRALRASGEAGAGRLDRPAGCTGLLEAAGSSPAPSAPERCGVPGQGAVGLGGRIDSKREGSSVRYPPEGAQGQGAGPWGPLSVCHTLPLGCTAWAANRRSRNRLTPNTCSCCNVGEANRCSKEDKRCRSRSSWSTRSSIPG